jgi:transketolase
MTDVQALCIQTIRTLSIDAVQKANSGHPGAPMGLAASAYTIWQRHLRHDPCHPNWPNRDRFILSNGHASMLLYSVLHLTGYPEMTLEQLQNFRQWGSLTPGHPEVGLTAGVEMTTGPLGQGLSTAVGMAIAEAHLSQRYDGLIDHYTYGICSDGDLMEGVTAEACSMAGHLGLGKLIFLYDDNRITIDGRTELTFTEDVLARFDSYGWHTAQVEDGNDVESIDRAIAAAKLETSRPSLISVRTVIGFGSPNKADSSASHGAPLGVEEVAKTKAAYGWTADAFEVPASVSQYMDGRPGGADLFASWTATMARYADEKPGKHAELSRRLTGELPAGWADQLPDFEPSTKGLATRASSGKVIESVYENLPELIGGSADLAGSTKTLHPRFGLIETGQFDGQNIHFGVREHAMAAIANGMCLHGGARGFGSTFLVFSDYMKPALRIAALSHIPSLMVFTHDSIGLGEDGPTHQPIEHIAALRCMPNYWVCRPADAVEVRRCWQMVIERQDGPSCLVLTRQNVPTLDRKSLMADGDAGRGAYILADCSATPEVILLATGSEVSLCVEAFERLRGEGVAVRVVSMPCWERFEEEGAAWREHVLPTSVTSRLAVEAASTFGWRRWVGDRGEVIGMESFGASAPADVLFEKFGFTVDDIVRRARGLMASDG